MWWWLLSTHPSSGSSKDICGTIGGGEEVGMDATQIKLKRWGKVRGNIWRPWQVGLRLIAQSGWCSIPLHCWFPIWCFLILADFSKNKSDGANTAICLEDAQDALLDVGTSFQWLAPCWGFYLVVPQADPALKPSGSCQSPLVTSSAWSLLWDNTLDWPSQACLSFTSKQQCSCLECSENIQGMPLYSL